MVVRQYWAAISVATRGGICWVAARHLAGGPRWSRRYCLSRRSDAGGLRNRSTTKRPPPSLRRTHGNSRSERCAWQRRRGHRSQAVQLGLRDCSPETPLARQGGPRRLPPNDESGRVVIGGGGTLRANASAP